MKPAEIDDSVPTEDDIAEAVTKLRRNRSGGVVVDPRRTPQRVDRGGQERGDGGGKGRRKRRWRRKEKRCGEKWWR